MESEKNLLKGSHYQGLADSALIEKRLDFALVGAAKSGTTSLFEYIRHHPQIFIPLQKEIPFFNSEVGMLDYDRFMIDHYSQAELGQLLGKITPQYFNYDGVADRIGKYSPQIKILALLRNPIDRAYSHFRMLEKRNQVDLDFEDAIDAIIGHGDVAPDVNRIFYPGRYHSNIIPYIDNFGANSIHLMFTEDLERDTKYEIQKLFRFLGIDENWIPGNLDKKYLKSSKHIRFGSLIKFISRSSLYKGLLRSRIPDDARSYMAYKLKQLLSVRNKKATLSTSARRKLSEYYKEEVLRLEEGLGIQVPWSDFRTL